MAFLDDLRRRLTGDRDSPTADTSTARAERTFGFSGIPGEASLESMTTVELAAWENRNIPSIDRASDHSEFQSDERQDVATTLNFPLHWTSLRLSGVYLFDFAVACDLLAPRPDDLVLDFAAGSCWATELLNRLGVRTVSIDLSLEMMRRGRQRLASDSRLVFRNNASFVVARGQVLPFADASFDGAMCLNALHHQPSYATALGEIYRVLKPGGRAVFSEPGTSHAAQPLSEFRMREESVIEKPVSLPLVRRLAREAGFSRMRVVPLRAAAEYAFDYTASTADGAVLQQLWDDTLRHAPAEHARFVLHKGDDPPPDTLMAANQLEGRLKAAIELVQTTSSVSAGRAFADRLRITNAGSAIWRARGRRFGGQVTCGLKVCDDAGDVIREDLGRTPLPRDVAPGETLEIAMPVAGELAPGRYMLRYDMVVEGVTWFEFQGSPCPRRPLEITP
jgi:SAM-dependent methyltransferase